MAVQKIYAGGKLRDLRTRMNITQKVFAEKLGVSLPYLNQMENNNRPVSATVVLGLAQEFGFDVTELQSGDDARLVSDMREALADPVFTGPAPLLADLRLAAANAPSLARAFLDLHAAYLQSHERLASLDEALGREDSRLRPSPWEEVRDFFHYCDNYIDAVDRAAENLSRTDPPDQTAQAAAVSQLKRHDVRVAFTTTTTLRHFDPDSRTLTLSRDADPTTLHFQLYLQLALVAHHQLLDATLDLANFQTPEARSIAKVGLANYFAGAAMMPYGAFQQAAKDKRHDLERLASQFDASLEQVAHRLSTLQRPGAKGLPFFFVRVDQAGTITKRHSATTLQFARYGGACPLWNVHRAFETPGQFLRQLAETPDGVRYFCLAREVSKPGGAWGAPVRRFAIGLGCEVKHASDLVYADHMQVDTPQAYEPIGISCRICERRNCHQRSVPPLERTLKVDVNKRTTLPYQLE